MSTSFWIAVPVNCPISTRFLPATAGPVLLVQSGALGDSILSLNVADQLAGRFPDLSVEMLGHLDYIRLFPGRSSISAVSDIDTAPLHLLFADPATELPSAFADYLHRFSAVISWFGQPDTLFARNLCYAVPGLVFFIDRGPPPGYPHHVVHYWLTQLFDTLPAASSSNAPGLRAGGLSLSPQDTATADTQLSRLLPWPIHSTDYFVFHPGAGSLGKCWPIDSFVQLAQRFHSCTDYRVVYLLGPAERERFSAKTLETLRNSAPVLSDLDITSAAALICRSRGFLGHDSGPTHLAAALGVPTVAIFGPTNPTHWQPLGPSVRLICPPPDRPQPSLDGVTINRVYQTLIADE